MTAAGHARGTRGKEPVTPLAGPYGHPFHPILVTVPIGAWVGALVFDVVSQFQDDPDAFTQGAYWLIGIGIIGALMAAIFGFLDLLAIPRGSRAFKTAVTHMTLNLTVVALFAVTFALRTGDIANGDATPAPQIVIAAVALALLGVSGWLGGKLTYHYGVRVADEATQSDGYR